MENSLIFKKIKEMQQEYKCLLQATIPILNADNVIAAYDEILIFWKSRINIINLYLRYLSPEQETYVFTAATYMDINDKENFPFVLLGDFHIMDDPLYKYVSTSINIKDSKFYEKLKEQILYTVNDNIKIISDCGDEIIILPVRILDDEYKDIIKKASDNVFLSLFKNNISTIEEYFENLLTIEDIEISLNEGVAVTLMLSEEDNYSNSFIESYKKAINNNSIINSAETDVNNFFILVYGYISQALDILFTCTEYKLIPYVRNTISFHYILNLYSNFYDANSNNELIYKSSIAKILYMKFNKTKINNINFYDFCKIKNKLKFNENLFNILNKKYNFKNYSAKEIAIIIEKNLEDLYLNLY